MTLEQPRLTVVWDGERAPLAKAFVAAQKATESIKKAATNPAFRSRYADLAHVVEGVVPALNDAGVGVLQFPSFDGEMVHVETTLLHESGSSVTGTLAMRPTKADPQGVGSAITYARRYSLLAMTGSAPEDDDGNAASRKPANEPVAQTLSEAQVDTIKRRMADTNTDPAAFLRFMQATSFEALNYDRAMTALDRKAKAAPVLEAAE